MNIEDEIIINVEEFTGYTFTGDPISVKKRFLFCCYGCDRLYQTNILTERIKKHKWYCKSCAIKSEWANNVNYRNFHVQQLKISNSTPKAKQRVSELSKRNWSDENIRKKMLYRTDEQKKSSAEKARKTLKENLLSGKTKYKAPHGKRLSVNNVYMRSSYETRFALYLNSHAVQWKYEPKSFEVLNGTKTYTPDFYLPQYDTYVEIKGWWRDDAKEKYEDFVTSYEDVKCVLLMLKEIKELESNEKTIENFFNQESRSTAGI